VELKKGDSLFIPKKIPHRVTKTKANTLWLAIHI
jgi:mannose-6-phosphate isomerase-like protein (cupin superfamily)